MHKKTNKFSDKDESKNIMTFTSAYGRPIHYDEVDENISGHLPKQFVRLHRCYIPELFEAIKNGSSYVTYLNEKDIINGNAIPQNISVLMKKLPESRIRQSPQQFMIAEELGSKIMNYFGVKTVYNQPLLDDSDFYILSIDFIKPHEYYFSENDITKHGGFSLNLGLKKSVEVLKADLIQFSKMIETEFNVKQPSMNLNEIIQDFLKSYFIRVSLLWDSDFENRNIGFIYNEEKNEIKLAPNFDYEYIGNNTWGCFDHSENLEFIKSEYPDLYEQLANRCYQLTKRKPFSKSDLDDILETQIHLHFGLDYYKKLIENNVSLIRKIHHKTPFSK